MHQDVLYAMVYDICLFWRYCWGRMGV